MEIWKLNAGKDIYEKNLIYDSYEKQSLMTKLKFVMVDHEILSGERDYFIVFSEEEKQRIREMTLELLGSVAEARLLNALIDLQFTGIYAIYITDDPRDLIMDVDPDKPNKSILAVRVP